MVGIRVLEKFYEADRKLWALVHKKACRFVIRSVGLKKADYEKVCAELVFTYSELSLIHI